MGSKSNGPGLYEFLIEAELQQYYNSLKNELKVQSTAQLKYVTEEDLFQVGMSRPEIRRLKKYFQKHFPTNVLAKMKKKLLSRGDNSISIASLTGGGSGSLGKHSRAVAPGRHIIQAESIQILKTLGSGEFGTVQQGVWTDHDGHRIQVAIKCLSQDRMENNPVEFLKEAAIMHNVDHEHIVRLYGVVLDTSALMLVTELAPLRSLLECLKEPSMRPNLAVPALYDFAVQICTGMEYLEGKRLIHRDLAARNILVFSRNKVKISDFGLSRALGVGKDYYQTNFNVNLKLPIAWCAPECINFLRFTSASDVWAYGVTLWEIFSYGFQPWAALTGQQILEAIDEPNYQRLEKPECCPHEIYYQIMLKCWQHDANSRPSFADLSTQLLPECKPEQVQAIRDSEKRCRRDYLEFGAGDIITVLEKNPIQGSSDDMSALLWKGCLKDGKTGVFNPDNTIAYLGSSFPTVKKGSFNRNDSRSSSLRKGKISTNMISGPQGDLKHTGHVGPDGQFFGDIAFMGSKSWVPRQVVPPYKPDSESSSPNLSITTPIARMPACTTSKTMHEIGDVASSDTAPLLTAAQMNMDENGHEYHEISDEENDLMRRGRVEMGVSNPALSSKSQSPLDSPRFEKSFDLEGPSLIDEVFGALQQDRPDEAHNVRNELRELVRSKKKFATVKPISSSDRKTLDHAIHLANELATRSMLELDRPGKMGGTNNSLDDISSPRTPNSPNHKRKFTFMLGGSKSERERRNYSQEAASIPDIQSTLSEEAKEAYNSLIEKPTLGALGFLTPSFENKSTSFHFPEKSSSSSKHSEFFETEASHKASIPDGLCTAGIPSSSGIIRRSKPRNLSLPDERMVMNLNNNQEVDKEEEIDGNPLRLLRQNKASGSNVLPLPPRDRIKAGFTTTSNQFRHQRKHPLLIPSKVPISSQIFSTDTVNPTPPPPPPKPARQHIRSPQQHAESELYDEQSQNGESAEVTGSTTFETPTSELSAVIASLRSTQPINRHTGDDVKLYENFDSSPKPDQNATEGSEAKENNALRSANEIMKPLLPRVPRREKPPPNLQPTSESSSPSADQDMKNANDKLGSLNVNSEVGRETTSFASQSEEEQRPNYDVLKVRTVRRIIGSSATDEECRWALEVTRDNAAHAVKLLRLKGLLPDSILNGNVEMITSALEMCSWDVARASAFLLDQDKIKLKANERSLTNKGEQENFDDFTFLLDRVSRQSSSSDNNCHSDENSNSTQSFNNFGCPKKPVL